MKKLLLIALLIVGCEETGVTTEGLGGNGTSATDTLYVFNNDTIIPMVNITNSLRYLISYEKLFSNWNTIIKPHKYEDIKRI